VPARYKAGDGWTATSLLPPRGSVGLPEEAVYRLEFRVAHQGSSIADKAGAKLVVDCRIGKLQKWTGPALRVPGT